MKTTDLSNAAYASDYIAKCNETTADIIKPENLMDKELIKPEGDYTRTVTNYRAKRGAYTLTLSTNKVAAANGTLVHEYINQYGHPFFCTPVTHSNGRKYLAYKEDLYGYSVLELETKKIFKYFPTASWKGGETFIVTDIHYNPSNDIVAAGGCYWACPTGVFLFEIKDPMAQFTRYLDIQKIMGNYDKYDSLDFQSWEGADLLLKAYNIENEDNYFYETIRLAQEEYENSMCPVM
ncbi:MAG: hypothetical protein FWE42_07660 [Defluviitaleaceae bacterium]|nr:hypothetical protein [Defluviitaleaceae bacterium]